jgi:alpha-glucosidase
MNDQTLLQHNKIQAAFEHSIFRPPHKYKVDFYKNLVGFVSRSAIDLIAEERGRIVRVGRDKVACGCALRSSHGLPCACELARYKCVPLGSVHPFWRRLSWQAVDPNEDPDEMDLKSEIAVILLIFEKADLLTKRAMKQKMR